MAVTLDPILEQRIHQELAQGPYRGPSELIAHGLDLIAAERRDRAQLVSRLEASIEQADRGEGIAREELRSRFETRKAQVGQSAA